MDSRLISISYSFILYNITWQLDPQYIQYGIQIVQVPVMNLLIKMAEKSSWHISSIHGWVKTHALPEDLVNGVFGIGFVVFRRGANRFLLSTCTWMDILSINYYCYYYPISKREKFDQRCTCKMI